VVNSISNNTVSARTTQRDQESDNKRPADNNSGTSSGRAGSSGDTIQVSPQGRLISESAGTARPASVAIENRAQAASLVAQIRQQFEQAGAAALQAQGGSGEGRALSGLLEAAPA